MKFESQSVQSVASARFGQIDTPVGKFGVPTVAPGIRTSLDVDALLENIRAGMPILAVSPYASFGATLGVSLSALKQPTPTLGVRPANRPLFISDPESEALSFNCVARARYLKRMPAPGVAIKALLSTGLRSQKKATAEGRSPLTQVHSTWREVERGYTITPVVNWSAHFQSAVKSDVLSLPTPIIRDASTAAQALALCPALVTDAREVRTATSSFKMVGPHLLLDDAIFTPDSGGSQARTTLLNGVKAWGTMTEMRNIVLSFKVHETRGVLTDSAMGSRARQNVSEFVQSLHHSMGLIDGMLVAHNWDNWSLGLLDSGADVATFRVTGRRSIEMPLRSRTKGERPAPPLFIERALVYEDVSKVMAHYRQHGAFPKPDCVEVREYWNLPTYNEQMLYAARVKCGVLTELGERYRRAGEDTEKTIREAVLNLVVNSRISQELSDLCPSV